MKLPIVNSNKINEPLKGFGFAFIDEEDNKLKIKKYDSSIIEFNNDSSDIQLLDLIDYTAFEIFAHDYDIPSGQICEELSGYVNYSLPACMTHEFTIRTDHSPENQNVIVDWGDGTIIKLSDVTPVSNSNYDYKIDHTYTATGKYIVKIFGNKYYAFKHAQENNKPYNNILCRVLSEDLPIASHLTNFSSFCLGANHIINLNITNTNFIKQCANMATMCGYCKNLISAVGFPVRNKKNISYGYLFTYCYSLETTDLQIVEALGSGGIGWIFRACKKLKTSPESILKYFLPAPGSTYNVTGLFYQCEVLTGTVPANKLWNNKQVTWTGTATCFDKCSDEIRSQVPVSWGGTNQKIDNELLIEDNSYYTAFEVLPHTELIPSGSVISGTILAGNIKDTQVLTSILNNDIPANTIQKIKIRTSQPDYSKSDVVIEWGDGSFSSIKNQNFTASKIDEVASEGDYTFEHDYAESLAKEGVTNKRYIIKIYGKQYYNFNFLSTSDNSNLMCRVFDIDLPVANHIGNIAQMCYWAKNLVYVNCECIKYRRFENCSGLFNGASNLVKVIGMGSNFSYAICSSMFSSCSSLISTDFKMPLNGLRTSLSQVFNNCPKLVIDVSTLFPSVYSNCGDIDVTRLFKWCSGLTLSDANVPKLAKILWNNKNINWLNTSDAFGACSNELRAKVPTSWGGTASDDIIEKDQVNLKFWSGTQEEYDALTSIDDSTLYIIKESE